MEKRQVVIIGSGPAGYTAGVYAARAQLAPLQYAGYKAGGQLMWTTDVENFPGFPAGKAGPELMSAMREQAQRFGTTIVDEFVSAVDFSARPFKVWTNVPDGIDPESHNFKSEEEFAAYFQAVMQAEPAALADSIIITTGAVSIMTNVPGEQKLFGKGVSTCAVCDAAFYRDKDTIVMGGGDSAMEDTLALTKFAKSVTVVHRRGEFRASKVMQERVLANEKVSVRWHTTLKEILGEDRVTGVIMSTTNPDTGEVMEESVPIDGVFVAIGHRPVSQLFKQALTVDPHGYIVTRQSLSKLGIAAAEEALTDAELVASPTMTSVEGVFAAGDVVDIRYKQAITAAGQGCQAALDAERWLEARG
ncbi:FAD-dependent oxidoreductase [Candidatus Woesebacteria bacterium]|nr:FAD-dependent oxidoreductase [Candidatus Woesebacteria bacterium]